jgi:hypothetical protein
MRHAVLRYCLYLRRFLGLSDKWCIRTGFDVVRARVWELREQGT